MQSYVYSATCSQSSPAGTASSSFLTNLTLISVVSSPLSWSWMNLTSTSNWTCRPEGTVRKWSTHRCKVASNHSPSPALLWWLHTVCWSKGGWDVRLVVPQSQWAGFARESERTRHLSDSNLPPLGWRPGTSWIQPGKMVSIMHNWHLEKTQSIRLSSWLSLYREEVFYHL